MWTISWPVCSWEKPQRTITSDYWRNSWVIHYSWQMWCVCLLTVCWNIWECRWRFYFFLWQRIIACLHDFHIVHAWFLIRRVLKDHCRFKLFLQTTPMKTPVQIHIYICWNEHRAVIGQKAKFKRNHFLWTRVYYLKAEFMLKWFLHTIICYIIL